MHRRFLRILLVFVASSGMACRGGAKDEDEDGFKARVDCDDADAAIRPDAVEVCDEVDNDCDGLVDDLDDDLDPDTASRWYADEDGDGFGDANHELLACARPDGFAAGDTDCNDADANIHPGMQEVCDPYDIDEDCSGLADDDDVGVDLSTRIRFYADTDGDNFGDADDAGTLRCDPAGAMVSEATDCDDGTDTRYPGAPEICDGVDNDCNEMVDEGLIGTGPACGGARCVDVLADDPTRSDGLYWLDPVGDAKTAAEVYCDMTTDGGGWTLISWTGSASTAPRGVPYPGLAVCPTQDCRRGSAASSPWLTALIDRSAHVGIGHSTNLPNHQNLGDYTYAGYYDYTSLQGLFLDPGTGSSVACDPGGFASGTFHVLAGPTDHDGKTMYLAQSFRQVTVASEFNDYAAGSRYIWNLGALTWCDGSGRAPGTWLGNWSDTDSEYGPYLQNTPGARAVWVR